MEQPIRCYTATIHGQEVTVRRFATPAYKPDYTWALPTSRGTLTVDDTWHEEPKKERAREQGD